MKKDTLYGIALLGALWWYTRKTPAVVIVTKGKKKRQEYSQADLDDLRKYPEPWKLNPGNYWTDAAGNIVPARIVALRG